MNNPARMAELTARALDRAIARAGPAQINIPRDFFYGEIDVEMPQPIRWIEALGGARDLDAAASCSPSRSSR